MSDPFVGQITMVGFDFAPKGWAKCDGATIPISQNPTLFAIIGTQYGGDGTTNFKLPDMRGRVPLSQGTLYENSYEIGEKGGAETVTLSKAELPAHNHDLYATNNPADAYAAAGETPLLGTQTVATGETLVPIYSGGTQDLVAMASEAISSTGGGQAHNNMQPVQVINFIIALEGIFPPRN
ncbi:phage tail protein [Photobacterium kasasachensis]|uniref:phage tail protein n=1 Tax=Photobacterium kasasachensis TaxID=2910240 RepID=UPI003D150142